MTSHPETALPSMLHGLPNRFSVAGLTVCPEMTRWANAAITAC